MDWDIDPQVLRYVLGIGFPIVVGLITKAHAEAWIKALALTALSALGGYLTEAMTADGVVDGKHVFIGIMTILVVGVATHFGVWKPAMVTGSEGVVQKKTANVGLGRAA